MKTVEILLVNDADPNILNHTGDTPLHKAALTSREVQNFMLLCYYIYIIQNRPASNPLIAGNIFLEAARF